MAKMVGAGVKKKVAAEILGVSRRTAWKFWGCVLGLRALTWKLYLTASHPSLSEGDFPAVELKKRTSPSKRSANRRRDKNVW